MSSAPPEIDDPKSPVLFVGAVLMLLGWLAGATIDAFFEGKGIWEVFFHPLPHDLASGILFAGLQVLFLFYLSRCMKKNRGQRRQLSEALAEAEYEKKRSQAFIDSVGDAISIQDLEMKILYQNRAHKELMGDHVGEYCYIAYQDSPAICAGCHLQRSYQDGQSHWREVGTETLSGTRYVEIISTPLWDASGAMVGGIEAVRDISERKKAELEIGKLNQELKLRADKLVEANRELEAFSYSLSHDLRSYITRISTAHQVLEAAFVDRADAAYPVQAIGESCQGMEDLIEAMLTLSHVTKRGMKVEEVVLSDLAQEIFLELQQQEMERSVDFRLHPGLSVHGDPYLLKLALKNLLENAWKYTRNVPQPRIEFGAEKRSGKKAIFVRDNGIGFSMDEKNKLFAPFQRLQSSRGFAGNGIGLATVARVVLRHGGEVDAEGEVGKGATMYLFLPEVPQGLEECPAAKG